jgi:hypothetical protein
VMAVMTSDGQAVERLRDYLRTLKPDGDTPSGPTKPRLSRSFCMPIRL